MKKMITTMMLTTLTMAVSGQAQARHGHGHATLEDCIKAAMAIKSGAIERAEYHNYSHEGKPSYEIEIIDSTDKEWEFECNTKGNIVEIEQEVESASDPRFKDKAKVSEDAAKKAALAVYPGKVEKTEYEIEFNGNPSYEFNIEDATGTEFNVEVNAITGEIIEVSTEGWEIGIEH